MDVVHERDVHNDMTLLPLCDPRYARTLEGICSYAWASVCAYVFESTRTPAYVFGGMRVSVRVEACACVHASVWQ